MSEGFPAEAQWVNVDRSAGGVRCGACGFAFPLDFGNVAAVLACPSCEAFVRMRTPRT